MAELFAENICGKGGLYTQICPKVEYFNLKSISLAFDFLYDINQPRYLKNLTNLRNPHVPHTKKLSSFL